MPAFQRGFVWDRKQILELLESIFQGFPIGSVLLWKVNQRELNLEDPKVSNFPTVDQSFPTHYILDGLQRLSSLYAVFHYDQAAHEKQFSFAFNLEDKQFVSPDPSDSRLLPLNILFKPASFIKHHSALQKKHGDSKYIENAVDLLSTFQEYLVPIVSISGRTVGEVVQIFERINSTGTRLGAVDFMRAVTWSADFDLNREIATLRASARAEGFKIPAETIVKVLAIALKHSPTPAAMLKMRELSASALSAGVVAAAALLKRTIRFFRDILGVRSYDLVPYEAQFLAIVGYNLPQTSSTDGAVISVARWFWTASLNEDLQGRSEHQVARLVEEMRGLREGKVKRLKGSLSVSPTVLKERRFRWGGSISSALVGFLEKNGARSLITGELIEPEDYVGDYAGRNFIPFADQARIAEATGKERVRGKAVANTIVCASGEVATLRERKPVLVIRQLQRGREDWLEILESQFISQNAMRALLKGRDADFLEARAQTILEFAASLTFPPANTTAHFQADRERR